MRVAMWSGPRNLSTAMMYAFGARRDFAVLDEPFYAPWLAATGADHPMAADILAAHETDPDVVSSICAGPVPGGKAHWYQKHMMHHMEDHFDLGWIGACRHVFLIRHPARVVASYSDKRRNPTAGDLGFARQDRFFGLVADRTGQTPLVIDSADVRRDPAGMLALLCDGLGLPWDPAMLHWPRGGHRSDGIWAAHWYAAVHDSTGFAGPEGPLPTLDAGLQALAATGMLGYERLRAHRIGV